ncbi:hypothetical protein EV213_10531 [Aureibacillus halotolerans]|uniref:Uncharacterized protein n=1 Tax=Aureibacillus halotolerans TaxID=1508390 RepID=A0A4R6U2V2_9BACI|nr:hypothetical protein EV213_10531 [Aureibacillus halotolerans]
MGFLMTTLALLVCIAVIVGCIVGVVVTMKSKNDDHSTH